ncbi:MAG: LytR/AlgR family response regulator transcription factor [Sediminibacterium sp.]
MTAIIIEDELQSRNQLDSLIKEYCPTVEVVGMASSVKEGMDLFQRFSPALIFLDIELGTESGFDLLTQIGNHPYQVIFTTAHERYGVRAIKFSALDYLLKPIEPSELMRAVLKATELAQPKGSGAQVQHLLKELHTQIGQEKMIAIPQSREIRFLQVSDIVYCAASNNYTTIFLKTGEKLVASRGIYYFEDLLQPTGFLRTHQSYLVNTRFIRSIKKEFELELFDHTLIPIAKLKLSEVKKVMLGK